MGEELQIGKFTDVDDSGQSQIMLEYLDRFEKLPGMPELRRRSFDLHGPVAGKTVIDVGCGTGSAVAQLVELGATSYGVEVSDMLLGVARSRHPGLDFRSGSAESLPCGDATADVVRAERVYMHLAEPQVALAEARRVLKPGGGVVLIDFDVDMWAVDTAHPDVTDALTKGFADTLTAPRIGRRYRALLLDAGFEQVRVELRPFTFTCFEDVEAILGGMAFVAVLGGRASQEEVDRWLDDQRHRSERDRMFLVAPLFVASAVSPA